jgi:hypothetical protein
MRGRRLVVAHETLLEIRSDEPIAQILFSNFECSRHCDVGVIGKQRFVLNSLRERMVSEKTVCPAADDDDLGEPRIKRLNQLG